MYKYLKTICHLDLTSSKKCRAKRSQAVTFSVILWLLCKNHLKINSYWFTIIRRVFFIACN